LVAKQQCEELPLCYLSCDAIAKYLSMKFPGHRFPAELAAMIYERTDGIPLFMVNTIDYLVAEGLLAKSEAGWELVAEIEKVELGVPDSIKQMIEKQIDHLDAGDQRTLEVASITGATFSTLPVASGLEEDRAAVEARCEVLARHGQFIQGCGVKVLPNGEAVSRYAFIHALYQNVLYERVSTARRIQLHRRIGEQGEVVYGDHAREIAAELAMHFEQCRDYKRAAKYLQQAADNAMRRFAYREAVSLARWGLELLGRLPDSTERAAQEQCLQLTLGVPLIATEGYAAEAVGSVYTRARELDQQLGGTPDIVEVLWGLWAFYILRVRLGQAREIAEELLRLSDCLPYPGLRMRGHLAMEVVFMHLGEVAPAREHFEKALSLFDPERHRDDAFSYAQNPGVAMLGHGAWTLWLLGQVDQAVEQIEEALTLARELREPHGLAHAWFFKAIVHQFRREAQLAEGCAEQTIAVASEHGLLMYHAHAMIARGWALLEQGRIEEAIEQIRQGIADHAATGTEVMRPHYLALLVEALSKAQQVEEGLRLLDEALQMAQRSSEGYYEAELYRLKGELLLLQSAGRGASLAAPAGKAVVEGKTVMEVQAESCFRQALDTAQRQQGKSLELRAGMSLARLYQRQGKADDARNLLMPIYHSFTEGFDTTDLREAKAMLDELS
jgi:predicted ATPase